MALNENVVIRQWQPCLEDARMVHEVMKRAVPQHNHAPPKDALLRIPKIIAGIEEGAMLAIREGQAVGAVMLSIMTNPAVARLGGGVPPSDSKQGIGRTLLERARQIATNHGCTHLRSSWFLSNRRAVTFMKEAGFVEMDRIYWSRFNLNDPLTEWARAKADTCIASGIRIVPATTFESLHSGWDRLWWTHLMTCLADVPSVIPFEPIAFDKWRPFIEAPFLDRRQVLVALDKNEMVGLMYVGPLKEHAVNIDHTSVARSHRRRGISVLLKSAAIGLARNLGAGELTTQNHQKNPMFDLNKALGFRHIETHIDGRLSIIP